MAKSKSAPKVAAPVKSGSDKVKNGRVSKPVEAPKVSKDLKAKLEKSDKKASKKSKKAPTPPPESESDSEDSESESDESSESEAEEVAKPKANGTSKAANGVKPAADESSESESESDSEADDAPVKASAPVTKSTAPAADSDESDSESESESDEEVSAKAGTTPAAAVVNGSKAEASSDEESDSEEDDESESESEEEEEAAAAPPAKKRKADDVEAPAAKKSKTESNPGGVKNLFVGNLSWNVDEDWLKTEFEEFGEISGVRIITDRDSGRSKGFGYVEYTDADSAAKALEAKKGSMLDGRELNVDFSTPRDNTAGATRPQRADSRANKFGDSVSTPSDTLFVGNISFEATAEVIQSTFEEYGSITRVTLPTDPETQALKGFGYVGFSSTEEAKAALDALNGADIAGRNIRLDFATPRADNGGSPRGGGRGGGFRGGRGGDRGGRGGRGGFSRGGRGDSRGGRGGARGGRGGSTNRGGLGDFSGKKMTF